MNAFCGSSFWDYELTWNTTRPDLTQCFQETVLVWIPCGFLWLFAPVEFFATSYSKASHIPWTILNMVKIFLASVLTALSIFDMSYAMMLFNLGENIRPADYYAPFIKAVSFILVIVLVNYGRLKGILSSPVLLIFWFLLSIKEIVSFRSELLKVFNKEISGQQLSDDVTFILVSCSFPLVLSQFVLFCFADTKISPPSKGANIIDCPEATSSFLSQITFWWFNSMALLGYKRPLVISDMWRLSSSNSSQPLTQRFDKHWIPAVTKALEKTENIPPDTRKLKEDDKASPEIKVNFLRPALRAFGLELFVSGLCKLVSSLMTFVNPIVLGWLITYVSTDEPVWRGYFYAGILLVSAVVESLFNSQFEYRIFRLAMRVRSALTATVYKKTLSLASSSRRNYTVGEIVNIMAVDVQRIMEYVQAFHWIWVCPLQVVITLYMLYQQLGVSIFAGVGVMILLIPINAYCTIKMKELQILVMGEKDKRTKLMNEILNGIKVLKLYAWEESFQDRVTDIRNVEVKHLKSQAYYSAITTFAFTSAPVTVSLATFAMYILVDSSNILDANKAFVSLALFNILRIPFASLPLLFTFTASFLVSLKRLNQFFSCEELDTQAISYDKTEANPVIIENGTFTWEAKEEPLLKNINLTLAPGSLVAVVGTVGSGKSSLLSALLGDMEKISGRVNIAGQIAYVPQQSWIQNATLRQNVQFTGSFENERYQSVLSACCLTPDLEILPGGDMTEIGEKGINLSGGQKQRVSLARAVYNDADIYLLDDPLSAVDSHVSKDLFDNVIGPKGLLKKKARILVSHRINVLPECDTIIVLKNGEISERGSYEELLERKGAFAEFLVQYLSLQTEEKVVTSEDLKLIEEIATRVGSPELIRQISCMSGGDSDAVATDTERDRPLSRQTSRVSSSSSKDGVRRRFSTSVPKTKDPVPTKAQNADEIKNAKLTDEEAAQTGSVKLSVYMKYVKACGLLSGVLIFLSFAAAYAFNIATNVWLSYWTEDSFDPTKVHDTGLRDLRLGVYGALGAAETFCMLSGSLILAFFTLRGARAIHDQGLDHILRAPMTFFDTTPAGRIINRFSKDIDSLDNIIRLNILMMFLHLFSTISVLIIVAMQTAYFLIFVLPLGAIYYVIQKFYIETSRQLKRLESNTRSPIFSYFSETVSGTTSIRAYGANKHFIREFLDRVDNNHTSFFPSLAASRWLAIRLEFIGYIISFLTALFAVLSRDSISAGMAGLSITYTLKITVTLNMLVRVTADVETNLVSVERCLEYTETPVEAPRKRRDHAPPSLWPDAGSIQFNGYSTRYRDGLDLVLRKIQCLINPNEKVGIVGRTGAGKSSLTLSLFRLIEAAEGSILIDGIDISKLGLYDLRSKLTVIPQDPVLFTGSLRMNLDPFESHCDEEIWSALEQSHLKNYVTTLEKGLDHNVIEGGENLSVGQRQLLCLGRALLRKTKVLIMDEATAAVDMETDELIQATIRSEFSDCTVLTIAHRLNTIMDYDRIMVLQNGQIAEFDSPTTLLENQASVFHSMAKDADLL